MLVEASEGGWTMNWRGMVMRCGEHWEQTTRPHFLQWCFLNKKVKCLLQTGHCVTCASGCQGGKTRSLSRLNVGWALGGAEYDGGGGRGRSREGAGDESRRIGSVLEPAWALLWTRMLEGRRMGVSAVVRRLLRSELLAEDDVSVRGGGREGRAKGGDDEGGSGGAMLGAVEVWVGGRRMRAGSTPASRRKSTHVSPPYASRGWARKWEATAPCRWWCEGGPLRVVWVSLGMVWVSPREAGRCVSPREVERCMLLREVERCRSLREVERCTSGREADWSVSLLARRRARFWSGGIAGRSVQALAGSDGVQSDASRPHAATPCTWTSLQATDRGW